MQRTGRPIRTLLLLAAACLPAAPAGAIVIRHDREDRDYRALAERHPEAVRILPDGAGVLIAPDWVLTAAHVARGVADRRPRVEVAGREIPVIRVFLHPRWTEMGAHDVGLLRLAEAVQGVQPAVPYAGSDEAGKVVTFVGNGDFGTGRTGPAARDGVRRGATNRVEEADADWLYFTFDEGKAATDLEGVSGPGDSGGPALLRVGDSTFTLGVSVFSDGRGQGPGRYGVREGYTRVSTHRGWIEDVLAGRLEDQGFEPGGAAPRGRAASVAAGEAGGVRLPEGPEGDLVAGYLQAYNSGDEAAMSAWIGRHFTEAYRASRSEAEHRALYRRMHDELFGRLDLAQVLEATGSGVTVLLAGSLGSMAEIRFELEGGAEPRISGMRVARVEVSRR